MAAAALGESLQTAYQKTSPFFEFYEDA